MSYTFLLGAFERMRIDATVWHEDLHEMHAAETRSRVQEIDSWPVVVLVSGMRKGLPAESVRQKPSTHSPAGKNVEGEVRGKILSDPKSPTGKVLCRRDCEKIQVPQRGSFATIENRGKPLQGLPNPLRFNQTTSPTELRSLSQNREDTRLPMFALQHRGGHG